MDSEPEQQQQQNDAEMETKTVKAEENQEQPEVAAAAAAPPPSGVEVQVEVKAESEDPIKSEQTTVTEEPGRSQSAQLQLPNPTSFATPQPKSSPAPAPIPTPIPSVNSGPAPPLSRIDSLKARVALDSRDSEAWMALLDDAHAKATGSQGLGAGEGTWKGVGIVGSNKRTNTGSNVNQNPTAGMGSDPNSLMVGDLDHVEEGLVEAREVYEAFFKVFPNAARQWQNYASLELSHSNFSNVESIFTRSLRSTPSVDLWRFYLAYTRRINPLPPPGPPPSTKGTSGPDGRGALKEVEDSEREKVRKILEGAYEFALRFIGNEKEAGLIWGEYIGLIKEREARTPWQEGQKMDDLRRAYQRAVSVPLLNVEQLWREWDSYENGLNRVTAKKFLAERSPTYMTARTALRDLKALTDILSRPILPRMPSWTPCSLNEGSNSLPGNLLKTTIQREREQVGGWEKYLKWEISNPLSIEDIPTLRSRLHGAFRKAVMHMRFFPEIWFAAAEYYISVNSLEEAASWLKQGMEACPESYLLHFAYTDIKESQKENSECPPVFESLINIVHARIGRLQSSLDSDLSLIDAEIEEVAAARRAKKDDEGSAQDVTGDEREQLRKKEESWKSRKDYLIKDKTPEIEKEKEKASVAWIKWMQFVRRTEGSRATRTLFSKARKSPYCSWLVYEASAMMEYHCSKDTTVATKVFELALKTFPENETLVVRYLDFLLSINDESNARAVFTRTIAAVPSDRARPIWDRWVEYIYNFGDGAAIQRIEAQLAEAYPEETPIRRLTDKHTYMDLDVISPFDLGIASTNANGEEEGGKGEGEEETMDSSDINRSNSKAAAEMTPSAKRARVAGAASSQSPPPASGRGAGARDSPMVGNQSQPQAPPPPPVVTRIPPLPDAINFFLSVLPPAASFDGPQLRPNDIFECLHNANLPGPPPPGSGERRAGGGGGGGGKGGGGRRRGRRR